MGISYQKKRQTPKGEAGGSIPFWRAKIEPLQVILGGLQRFIFYRHILFCEIIEGRKHALLLSLNYLPAKADGTVNSVCSLLVVNANSFMRSQITIVYAVHFLHQGAQ